MSVSHINDIEELPNHFLKELRVFFEDYKKLENKTVDVEEFQNKEVAQQLVKQSMVDYKNLIKLSEPRPRKSTCTQLRVMKIHSWPISKKQFVFHYTVLASANYQIPQSSKPKR
jgi:hypothetical protein